MLLLGIILLSSTPSRYNSFGANGSVANAVALVWKRQHPAYITQVGISQDGTKTLVQYVAGVDVLNADGSEKLRVKLYDGPTASTISSDGSTLVVGNTNGEDYGRGATLVWFIVSTGEQARNISLGYNSLVDSLSMSADKSIVVLSGRVNNQTGIFAFDSQGQPLWSFIYASYFTTAYASSYYVQSSVAVSQDGRWVATARKELGFNMETAGAFVGQNNGVALFDRLGSVVWNYTSPDEWFENVAISNDGGYVAAGSSKGIYLFGKRGEILFRIPQDSSTVALSGNGTRFVGGGFGGGLFSGGISGPSWQMGVGGLVESVGMSQDGAVSAAMIYRFFPKSSASLLYVQSQHQFLGNFTFQGWLTGQDRVGVSGSGCCIIASIGNSSYYFRSAVNSTTSLQSAPNIPRFPLESIVIVIGLLLGVSVVFARKRHHDGYRHGM